MLITAYILVVALATLLAAVNCVVPAVILAGVALCIVLRREIAALFRSATIPRLRTDP
jgi:hypothetical protein